MGKLRIFFQRKGCRNRHFFNIVVARNRGKKGQDGKFMEQLGTFDPYPNNFGQKMVLLDIGRFRYWLGTGVDLTPPVAHLLGVAGLAPIYPPTVTLSKRRTEKIEQRKREKEREEKEKAERELEAKEEKEKAESELESGAEQGKAENDLLGEREKPEKELGSTIGKEIEVGEQVKTEGELRVEEQKSPGKQVQEKESTDKSENASTRTGSEPNTSDTGPK